MGLERQLARVKLSSERSRSGAVMTWPNVAPAPLPPKLQTGNPSHEGVVSMTVAACAGAATPRIATATPSTPALLSSG
jgi:hypothetical protein